LRILEVCLGDETISIHCENSIETTGKQREFITSDVTQKVEQIFHFLSACSCGLWGEERPEPRQKRQNLASGYTLS
jgi:hypothetical protein